MEHPNKHCVKAVATLQHLHKIMRDSALHLHGSVHTHSVDVIRQLRVDLQNAFDEARFFLEPFQLSFRKKLAHEKGFAYCGAFTRNGVARAKKNYKWSLIDVNGDPVTKTSFLYISSFTEGRAFITDYQRYRGITDPGDEHRQNYLLSNGSVLLDEWQHSVEPFDRDRAIIHSFDGEYWLIDQNGRKLTDTPLINKITFHNDRAWLDTPEGYRLIDRDGQYLNTFLYSEVQPFSCDRAWVKTKQEYFCVDMNGKRAFRDFFHEVTPFDSNVAIVGKKINKVMKRWIVDVDGKFIADVPNDFITPFSNGYAVVRDDRGSFHITPEGKEVYPERYQAVSQFFHGVAYARKDVWNACYIDTQGNVIRDRDVEPIDRALPNALVTHTNNNNLRIRDCQGNDIFHNAFSDSAFFVYDNGMVWAANSRGVDYLLDIPARKIIRRGSNIRPDWPNENDMQEGVFEILDKNGASYYIDRSGRMIFSQ